MKLRKSLAAGLLSAAAVLGAVVPGGQITLAGQSWYTTTAAVQPGSEGLGSLA
jgi:hypothetical protein